ncbi:hypothetical protein [Lysinibacillus sp. LZ02]|uniref:hypothetical protein n=1 Tax=Lysinibacillus sp. LZ02 TaxID=3420668 RepID=UPI003D360E8B
MTNKTYAADPTRTTIAVHGGRQVLMNTIFDLLVSKGFEIQTDQRILEEYPILADSHWEGKKGDLLFKAEIYPAGFKLQFYQEVVTQNPNGGYYDFDKYQKMPYLIRLQFIVTRNAVCNLLEAEGYTNKAKPQFKYAMDKVLFSIRDSCHFEEGQDTDGYTPEDYNNKDRDKKAIFNGQMKYFRGYDGRLRRGIVYHNLNNMWWVIVNKYEYRNVASFNLFDVEPGQMPERRIQRKTIPERIRVQKLRDKFKLLGLDYGLLDEGHIQMLRSHLTHEFKHFAGEITFNLSPARKKDIKVLKRTGLQYAVIQVDGDYFSRREAITFNANGFIGFAGWASDYNLLPFANAFEKWMNWLTEVIEVTA